MMYDDTTKQWLSPNGSSEAARSQVRILHNVHTNAFRIVGTRLQVSFRFFSNNPLTKVIVVIANLLICSILYCAVVFIITCLIVSGWTMDS